MVIKYGSGPARENSTPNILITKWDTSIAGGTVSGIRMPFVNQTSNEYRFSIDWGDGTKESYSDRTQLPAIHTYDETGIYTIRVVGTILGWDNTNYSNQDDAKLIEILNWGPLTLKNDTSFYTSTNLTYISADDYPNFRFLSSEGAGTDGLFGYCSNLTGIKNLASWTPNQWDINGDMGSMFRNCTNFNQDISAWDTSSVTDMSSMFRDCLAFNQDIGNWNTSGVTNMQYMFYGASSFNQDIGTWDVSNVTDFRNCFWGATAFDTSLSGWDFTNNLYTINLFGNTDYFNRHTVDGWVFGTNAAGLFYEVIDFSGASGNVYAINNNSTWSNVTGADTMFAYVDFNGAQWVTGIDFSNIQDFSFMFYYCDFPAGFTLSGIDFSSAKNFSFMFGYLNQYSAINSPSFPDLRGVTTGLEKTRYMFQRAYHFDQELLLDLSNADNISYMFDNASDYNNGGSSSISGWDTSNVTIMVGVFNDATNFNQPIGTWDTSSVTSMSYMFKEASSFNQPLSGWNVSNVYTMANMFELAPNFNQDIGAWDVSNVTDMFRMFRGFSYSIGTFNNGGSSSISGWNTSKVQSMDGMFRDQTSFNQPIGAWNTSSLTNIREMFYNADAFDQDLSNWTVTGISNAFNFMNTANGLSTTNYDRTLSGWSSQAVKNGVSIHFGGSKYSTATGLAYRNALVASGWTITDGGAA